MNKRVASKERPAILLSATMTASLEHRRLKILAGTLPENLCRLNVLTESRVCADQVSLQDACKTRFGQIDRAPSPIERAPPPIERVPSPLYRAPS